MISSKTWRLGRRRTVQAASGLVVGAICIWLVQRQLDQGWAAALPDGLRAFSVLHWLGGIVATAASLWALARYDVIVHRHLGTGVGTTRAMAAGAASIAVSQFVGLGILSGTVARWRMVPSLSLTSAALVTAFCGASFLAALGVLLGLSAIAAGPAGVPGALGLVMILGLVTLALPRLRFGGLSLRLPGPRATAAILGFAALDTLAAAAALWVFLPETGAPGFAAFYPLFLLAYGAALFSGSPGGLGPFELALLALMPTDPTATLAAIAAFRAVYFVLPLVVALGVLLILPKDTDDPLALRASTARHAHRHPELAALVQNGGGVARLGQSEVGLVPFPLATTVIGDALDGLPDLRALHRLARDRNGLPCLYKVSARTALEARRHGWSVLRIAAEAELDVRSFDLRPTPRRSLRRKLRHAAAAGIVARETRANPADLAEVHAAWLGSHGTERGGTMGRFEARLVASERLFCAHDGDRLVAFATFHDSGDRLTLDLVRMRPDAPDGTMPAIIMAALATARADGIATLSLAAAPDTHPRWRFLVRGDGLRRSKTLFAPRWRPLYAAAPGPLSLALTLADIAREVHFPPPLASNPNRPHELHEHYEFASDSRL